MARKQAGKDAGERVAADMKRGDEKRMDSATAELRDARGKAGILDVLASYLPQIARATMYATPAGLAAIVGESIEHQVARRSGRHTVDRRSLETLKAKELIDTYDIKMKLSQAVSEGVAQGIAKADHPARREPIGFTRG